jgi:hypothetical protein
LFGFVRHRSGSFVEKFLYGQRQLAAFDQLAGSSS